MERYAPSREYPEFDTQSYFSMVGEQYDKLIDVYLSDPDMTLQQATDAANELMNNANQELGEQEILGCDVVYTGKEAIVPSITEGLGVAEPTTNEEPVYGAYNGIGVKTETHDEIGIAVPRFYHRILLNAYGHVSNIEIFQRAFFANVPFYEAAHLGLGFFTNTPKQADTNERWRQEAISGLENETGRFQSAIEAYEKIMFSKKSRRVTEANVDWLCDNLIQHADLKNAVMIISATFAEEVREGAVSTLDDYPIHGKVVDVGTMKNYFYEPGTELSSYEPHQRWLKLRKDIALIMSDTADNKRIFKIPLRAIKQSN